MTSKLEITTFIQKQNKLSTLRLITCGSVDDGKSTLLGRILYESKLLFDDQVDALIKDSKKSGTQGGGIDFALLVDGLSAEREQGITIDVAYRYFSTSKRKFIVADSPGHEEYTRNMATAASNADLAIILVDARNGILAQTKRHSYIANLMGIKHVVVAINKMDLVDFNQEVFENIIDEYNREIQSKLQFMDISFIPVSALHGDNIFKNSKKMAWYNGNSLMQTLETTELSPQPEGKFNMSVQLVNRPNLDFRGYSGLINSGHLSLGDEIEVAGTKLHATVKKIFLGDKDVNKCWKGDSVTLVLDREIDISRGSALTSKGNSQDKYNMYSTTMVWFDSVKCFQNNKYIIKTSHTQTNCEILKIKNKIGINNYENAPSSPLEMNDISNCDLLLDEPLYMLPYKENNTHGNFILIDKKTNLTVAAGVINHHLRRSENIKWQQTDINLGAREDMLGQQSLVIWFTGLSGAGKSTIANLLEKRLSADRKLTYLLDGDNLRHGLNKDLGFTEQDRIENIRRVGEVSKILFDAGIIVLASFISPYEKDRKSVKDLFPRGKFLEIYVSASLERLYERDTKGLYKKASEGKLPNFTGISSLYEEPIDPAITINTDLVTPEAAVDHIFTFLEENKCI